MSGKNETIGKKTYSTPALSDYGNLTLITAAASSKATNKDGGPNNTKSN